MNELHRNILHLNVNLKINHMGKKITLRACNLHSANPASQNWPGAQISTPVLIFTPAVSWCFHHWIGLHPVHQCIIVFPCRRRRLLCSGEEDRPGGDHGAGASEGQRVLVKRGGSRWSGQPQRSRHALRGGGSQSAAVHQRQLRHFHTREHTWRTAVSTVRLTFTHTHIIRDDLGPCDTGKNIIFFSFVISNIVWQYLAFSVEIAVMLYLSVTPVAFIQMCPIPFCGYHQTLSVRYFIVDSIVYWSVIAWDRGIQCKEEQY